MYLPVNPGYAGLYITLTVHSTVTVSFTDPHTGSLGWVHYVLILETSHSDWYYSQTHYLHGDVIRASSVIL